MARSARVMRNVRSGPCNKALLVELCKQGVYLSGQIGRRMWPEQAGQILAQGRFRYGGFAGAMQVGKNLHCNRIQYVGLSRIRVINGKLITALFDEQRIEIDRNPRLICAALICGHDDLPRCSTARWLYIKPLGLACPSARCTDAIGSGRTFSGEDQPGQSIV